MKSLHLALFTVLISVGVSACKKTEHGTCPPPQENLDWFWQKESGTPGVGTLYKCVLCDTTVEEDGVVDWVYANAGEDFLSWDPTTEGMTACLYVYGGGGADISDEAMCENLVCGAAPGANDVVYKHHGMWKTIEPVIEAELAGYHMEGQLLELSTPEPASVEPPLQTRSAPGD